MKAAVVALVVVVALALPVAAAAKAGPDPGPPPRCWASSNVLGAPPVEVPCGPVYEPVPVATPPSTNCSPPAPAPPAKPRRRHRHHHRGRHVASARVVI